MGVLKCCLTRLPRRRCGYTCGWFVCFSHTVQYKALCRHILRKSPHAADSVRTEELYGTRLPTASTIALQRLEAALRELLLPVSGAKESPYFDASRLEKVTAAFKKALQCSPCDALTRILRVRPARFCFVYNCCNEACRGRLVASDNLTAIACKLLGAFATCTHKLHREWYVRLYLYDAVLTSNRSGSHWPSYSKGR